MVRSQVLFCDALGHDCEAKNSDIEAEESDEHLRRFANRGTKESDKKQTATVTTRRLYLIEVVHVSVLIFETERKRRRPTIKHRNMTITLFTEVKNIASQRIRVIYPQ